MERKIAGAIVVTRHAALVDFLCERGLIEGSVVVKAQVSPAEVCGRHVIGVLPLHLAAFAESVTTVDLDIPNELRGAELSLDQLRAFARAITTYQVKVLE